MGLKKGLQLIEEQERVARRVFAENGLSPAPDFELTDLVAINLRELEEGDLGSFLRAQKRFDKLPVTIGATGETVWHYFLREALKELPGYMEAIRAAGLDYEQSTDLLNHATKSTCHDFGDEHVKTIRLLARACNEAALQKMNLSGNLKTFKEMISLAGDYYLLNPSLYAFQNGARLGLSVEQMYRMIKKLPEVGSPSPGYVIPQFNDALKSMLPARANPELVVEVLNLIGDNNGYYSGLYDFFTTVMAFGGPSRGMTPDEVLALFHTRLKSGKKVAALLEGAGSEKSPDVVTIQKDKYFIENERNTLEHTTLPYRIAKSFNPGIRDLENLAVANMRYWEEVAEGMWVFDPASNVWYSLGGKTEVHPDRTRHSFLPYDISQLSDEPMVCHVHPKGLDGTVRPWKEDLAIPEYQDKITAFLTATPSRADYGALAELLKISARPVRAQAAIVHSLGTTVIRFPNNVGALESMSEKARDLRDQVMLEFDTSQFYRHGTVDTESDYNFVQRLLTDFNRKLPQGFTLEMYPTNHQFSI